MSEFCVSGVGVKTIAKRIGEPDDFSGCYVFVKNTSPFYVGISRGVIARVRQHVRGTTHSDASLAYNLAKRNATHKVTRTAAMKTRTFAQAFKEAKQFLTGCKVAFVKIENPLKLYLFEAYCAMELNTFECNTFRTH